MPNQRVWEAPQRQQGRAAKYQEMVSDAALAYARDRAALRERIERRNRKQGMLIEAMKLEKDLENRRCQLCDQMRSEAWGLGHTNWFLRKCGACWARDAEQGAAARHASPAAAAAADPPPDEFELDEVIAALRARDADRLLELLDARSLQRHFGVEASPHENDPHGPYGEGAWGNAAGAPQQELLQEQEQQMQQYAELAAAAASQLRYFHEAVFAALSPERIEQILKEPLQSEAQQHKPSGSRRRNGASGGDERDDGASHSGDGSEGESGLGASGSGSGASSPGSGRATANAPVSRLGQRVLPKKEDSGDEGSGGSLALPRRQRERRSSDGLESLGSGSASGEGEDEGEGIKPRRGGKERVRRGGGGGEGVRSGSEGSDDGHGSELSFRGGAASGGSSKPRQGQQRRGDHAHGAGRGKGGGYEGASSDSDSSSSAKARPPQPRAAAGGVGGHRSASAAAPGAGAGAGSSMAWATMPINDSALPGGSASPLPGGADGRRRPLPSKPRRLPTSTAAMEAALKQAEHDLVFAPTQHERSAALFYADQLRSALADIRRLDRMQLRAEQAARRARRDDPRVAFDAHGVKRNAHVLRENAALRGGGGDVLGEGLGVHGAPAFGTGAASFGTSPSGTPTATRLLQGFRESVDAAGTGRGGGAAAGLSSSGGRAAHAASSRDAAEKAINKALKQYGDPKFAPYIDPPRRPENQPTTHPYKPDPVKVADVLLPWRPASAKVPLPHPPGFQSVGDFDDKPWRREAERMRQLSLDHYRSLRQSEREWRALVAQAQAQRAGDAVREGRKGGHRHRRGEAPEGGGERHRGRHGQEGGSGGGGGGGGGSLATASVHTAGSDGVQGDGFAFAV